MGSRLVVKLTLVWNDEGWTSKLEVLFGSKHTSKSNWRGLGTSCKYAQALVFWLSPSSCVVARSVFDAWVTLLCREGHSLCQTLEGHLVSNNFVL